MELSAACAHRLVTLVDCVVACLEPKAEHFIATVCVGHRLPLMGTSVGSKWYLAGGILKATHFLTEGALLDKKHSKGPFLRY